MIATREMLDETTMIHPAIRPAMNRLRGTTRLQHILEPLLSSMPKTKATKPLVPSSPKAWCKREAEEQNAMVAAILGWTSIDGGPTPAYAQTLDLSTVLINIAVRISWRYTKFVEILNQCLSARLHLDPRVPLHPSQIYTTINPVDVAYAFVCVFGQQKDEIPWR